MLIGVLNGPNLNLLGTREPDLYGRTTLAEIEAAMRARAAGLGHEIEWLQSNHEGALVDAVQGWRGRVAGAVVNAAGFSHTSVALRDAFLAVPIPFVEVHLTNIYAREEVRRSTVLADLAVAVVAGLGPRGYVVALEALADRLREA